MNHLYKSISKKALLSLSALSLMFPLMANAQSNINDYTKAPSTLTSEIMNLKPNTPTTSDDELRSVFNSGSSVRGSAAKMNSFCAESVATTGKVVGTIHRQKAGDTILLVSSGKHLVKVEQTAKTKDAKIGSTVSVPARNCD